MVEGDREGEILYQKGATTTPVATYIKAFKDYIGYPTFQQHLAGESKYDDYQKQSLDQLLSVISVAQAETNIKQALELLQQWKFDYSWDGFREHYSKWKTDKEIQKIAVTQLNIVNYLENVHMFHKIQPFFYDRNKIFWFWQPDQSRYTIVDEIDVMVAIERNMQLYGQTVTRGTKANYLEAFKRVGREKIPKDAPKHWVQFKNRIVDIKNNKSFDVSPEYFLTNPIAWKVGDSIETPAIDKLFTEWVGEKYVKTLYEIIAYCCLSDYPIHLAFCLIGSGRNGKTQFQRLIYKFIGAENITCTELDTLLTSRFETFKLYKKSVCLLGETNFGVLNKTSILKKLTGGDLIGYEKKCKDGFDGYSYATVIINSNSLPTTEDTSEGYYRRWLIIDFYNEFSEGKDILETIPDKEYNNLTKKVIGILPKLLERGMFTNQGTIEERKQKYIMSSNPLPFFIKEYCTKGFDCFVTATDLYNAYTTYLIKNKKRKVSRKEFNSGLAEEGYFHRKCEKKYGNAFVNGYFIEGLEQNQDWKPFFSDNSDKPDNNSHSFSSNMKGVEKQVRNVRNVRDETSITEETIE